MSNNSGLIDQFGRPLVNVPVENDLGLGIVNPFTFPQNQTFPGSAPVENVNTSFKNLRWYLVSDFRQFLSQLYVELGLVQTICAVPVQDAFRGGVTIKSKQLDEDEIEELQNSLDRDDDLNTIVQAHIWNRLFGGAGLITIVGDQDPEEPLNVQAIGKDTTLEFRAADMWELSWAQQNTEGYDPSMQMVEVDYFNYYGEKIHKSRVMRLKGISAPSFIRPRVRGWGLSIVETLLRSLNQYLKSTSLCFEVLDEFKVDVYKIKDLVNTLMSPNGQQKVNERIQRANYQKNYQNALVMSTDDDWDHKQLSFAGLAETMDGIRMQVAADMRMPITKLFGTSASKGIGNTDQNDMENYNSMVESEVRNKAKYDVLRVCEIKCQKLYGFVPNDLTIAFKPLRVLSAEQEENVKTQKFNRLSAAKAAGEITSFEYREAINKGNLLDITLDNSGDELNPDDPQIESLIAEGPKDPNDGAQDIDDPGTDRADTQKVRASERGGVSKGLEKPSENQKKNSVIFDRKSYEADGGDSWISPQRLALEVTLTPDNPGLLSQVKQESQEAYGLVNYAFVFWLYKKKGGRLI